MRVEATKIRTDQGSRRRQSCGLGRSGHFEDGSGPRSELVRVEHNAIAILDRRHWPSLTYVI